MASVGEKSARERSSGPAACRMPRALGAFFQVAIRLATLCTTTQSQRVYRLSPVVKGGPLSG